MPATDPALPPDPPRTRRFLASPAAAGPARFRCGGPVWSAKTWAGDLYPPGTPAKAMLAEYARRFATVELNSTFYHPLERARLAAWAAETPAGFAFCPKLFRGITEKLDGPGLAALVSQFATAAEGLGDRLGLCFATPPETFAPADLPLLGRLLTAWPRALPLAVELRHPGWFTPEHALIDAAIDLLYRHGVATVITDTLGRRDALHLSLTQPRLMLRFLGCGDAQVDAARIAAWGERLTAWSRGLADVHLIAHQPEEAAIPATARALMRAVGQTPPPPALAAPPARGLFDDTIA
jgi:uncharacterized protein YecE (DUF72 family)